MVLLDEPTSGAATTALNLPKIFQTANCGYLCHLRVSSDVEHIFASKVTGDRYIVKFEITSLLYVLLCMYDSRFLGSKHV